MTRRNALLCLPCLFLPVAPVFAQAGSPGAAGYSVEEILVIKRYFEGPGAPWKPKMAGHEKLFPKSAKAALKLGAPLPPDLRRKAISLPRDLEAQLAPDTAGVQRLMLGSRVLLLDGSSRIVDLIEIPLDETRTAPRKK